jgi:putative endonuclease
LAGGPARNAFASSGLRGGRVAQWSIMVFVDDSFAFTYVLKSLKDGKHYIGWTDNLKRRFEDHCQGRVDATAYRRPLRLEYFEACHSKEKAAAREKYFKTGFGRRYLKTRI